MSEIKWSRDYMAFLATNKPDQLIDAILSGSLPPKSLTFAAEYLGGVNSSRAITVLLALSRHPSAIVREGAVYGLYSFVENETVKERLKEMHHSDASPGVRAATESLNE